MIIHRTIALIKARNIEFFRDRSSLAWNLFFPVFIIFGFAFAFSGDGKPEYKIGVVNQGAQESAFTRFQDLRYIEFVPYSNEALALEKLSKHQLDLVIDNASNRYWLNENSSHGYLVEKVMLGVVDASVIKAQVKTEAPRYIDWFIPGILGMNMMFSGLFGVGYVIVRYRKNGVLKRLKATPISAFEFLLAQVLSRLFIIVFLQTVIFIGCYWLLDLHVAGSFLLLFLIAILGGFSMISLGLLVASGTRSEELAGGLLNFITWPMMFLSGVWFSLEGSPHYVQLAAKMMPLTHVIESARQVSLYGASFWDIAPLLLTIFLMALACLLIGAWRFKWD